MSEKIFGVLISGPDGICFDDQSLQGGYFRARRILRRALALVIKAKLEAVASGITIFEEEFMAHLVTAGGRTLGERLLPEVNETLKKGASVPLLTDGRS